MSTKPISFLKVLKAGAIVGLIGAGINNIWSLIANALGSTIPPNFVVAIALSSIFPILIAAILFFVFARYIPNGKIIWIVASIAFLLFSFYPVFNTPQLPDGTVVDKTFPLLVGPMHAFSGFLAIWGIPKWSM